MNEPILVQTNLPDHSSAQKIAKILIKKSLVACVNVVGPISSIYNWREQIVNNSEYKLFIKSRQDKLDLVFDLIKKNHPYDLPEILAIPIKKMDPDYQDWLNKELDKH